MFILSELSSPAQVQWLVARDPVSGSLEELYVCGNRVVWYRGLHPETKFIKVSYSAETPVVQALWCQFDGSSGENTEGKKKLD